MLIPRFGSILIIGLMHFIEYIRVFDRYYSRSPQVSNIYCVSRYIRWKKVTTLDLFDSEPKVRVQKRPRHSCKKCHSNLPSILDLNEHERVDHNRTGTDDKKSY